MCLSAILKIWKPAAGTSLTGTVPVKQSRLQKGSPQDKKEMMQF
jgi:hypothetical protein